MNAHSENIIYADIVLEFSAYSHITCQPRIMWYSIEHFHPLQILVVWTVSLGWNIFSLSSCSNKLIAQTSKHVFERSFDQAFDRVWSFLNLFSKRPREKKELTFDYKLLISRFGLDSSTPRRYIPPSKKAWKQTQQKHVKT